MEYSPSRQQQSNHHAQQPISKPSEMAMLAASPAAPTAFSKEFSWGSSREQAYAPQPKPNPSNSISLPSIRSVIPEFHDTAAAPRSADTSPTAGAPGPLTSPAYVPSPVSNKRRRESIEDEQEAQRLRQVPRLYHNTGHSVPRQASPHAAAPPPPPSDPWARRSPFSSSRNHVAASGEAPEPVDSRHAVHGVPPSLGVDRSSVVRSPARGYHAEEYRDHHHAAPAPYHQRPVVDSAPRYPVPAYEHTYHHVEHARPRSPPHHTYERTPFSAGPYARQYGEYSRYGELAHMGNDTKQRKRRGNLPKETTDKLRKWFLDHLSHPYPTEDEKQELMRQTNLQMNQISNWFINARRRQLPTMINNARVTSDIALSGRAADGKVLPSTERPDTYSHTLSDGEGGVYDDDFDSLKHSRAPTIKRGSV